MKYLDVRIRVATSKLGQLINLLPDWAPMVGYDKLEEVTGPKKGSTVNGTYTPGKGTAAEAILKLIEKEPLTCATAENLLRTKFERRAVSSAFYGLRSRGLIAKQKDGRYGQK